MKSARKRKWQYILYFMALLIIGGWIPVVWHDQLTIDKAKFANVYYSTLLDVGKIFLGFWLANFYIQRLRLSSVKNLWRESITSLGNICESLLNLEPNSGSYQEQRRRLDNIHNKICRLRARMEMIALLSEPFVDALVKTQTIEYLKEVLGQLNKLCEYFEMMEIDIGKPLSSEQKKLVKDIYSQAEIWLREIE